MPNPDPDGTLIMEVHRNAGVDRSPLQMISAERLAYLERCEAELLAMKAAAQTTKPTG